MSAKHPALTKEQLDHIIAEFERKKMRRQLDAVYRQIEGNDCQRCGDCCFNSAQVLMVEFVNIYSHVQGLSEERQKEISKRALLHEMLNMVTLEHKCPFQDDDNTCAIYEVRPLQCHFFGLYPEREYDKMRKAGLDHNRDMAIVYARNYRIPLPEDVMTYDVVQCSNNIGAGGVPRVIGRPERDHLYTQVLSAQGRAIPDWATYEDETVRFSYVFATLYFEPQELEELRIEVMREFTKKGSSEKLDAVLKAHRFGFGMGRVLTISGE